MSKLTAEKYLRQLEHMRVNLDMDEERLEHMRAKVYGASGFDYSRERVQTSSGKDQQSESVIRLMDFQKRVEEERERYERLEDTITDQIGSLSSPIGSKLLFKVYVQFKSIQHAACEIGVSQSYAYNIHTESLREFEDRYPEQCIHNKKS